MKRSALAAIVMSLGLAFAATSAFGDSVTANFDLNYAGSTVPSQGSLALTLQPDGSILGQFTAPNIPGYQFINMDFNYAGPQSAANNLSVYFVDPSSSYNGCLTNGPNCALAFVDGPLYDNFGTFSFQLDWYNGAPALTSFDFRVTQPGGFTSVDSLVGLSGSGPCPNPPGPNAAVGCVNFQLFNEPFSYTGAIATSPSPVPEPASWLLLATGMLGLGAARGRRLVSWARLGSRVKEPNALPPRSSSPAPTADLLGSDPG
ncbi:MAG: PEP-CTERM sorting domain-containing protein [Acidiferrobacteraceae bacterium]